MKTHKIKFCKQITLHVTPPQGTGKVRTKPITVQAGDVVTGVTIRAYVEDFTEKCDIALSDGSEALGVKYARFQFVDDDGE